MPATNILLLSLIIIINRFICSASCFSDKDKSNEAGVYTVAGLHTPMYAIAYIPSHKYTFHIFVIGFHCNRVCFCVCFIDLEDIQKKRKKQIPNFSDEQSYGHIADSE